MPHFIKIKIVNAMNLLAYDISAGGGTIAVFKNSECVKEVILSEKRKHASLLVPALQSALKDVEIDLADLDAIITTNGPGSFTGIRIGLSAAKGLEISLKKPIITFDNFEAYFHLAGDERESYKQTLVVLDAFREDVYCKLFSNSSLAVLDSELSKPQNISIDEIISKYNLENTLIIGSALGKFKDIELPSSSSMQTLTLTARDMGNICLSMSETQLQSKKQAEITPFYLRPPDVNMKK